MSCVYPDIPAGQSPGDLDGSNNYIVLFLNLRLSVS